MAAINWEPLFKKYKGQWLALEDDEKTVIAAGATLKEARRKASEAGHPHPIFTKMPRDLTYFAG